MVEVPLWLGAPPRPLAALLHLPADGRASAGVVLCPPLGWERVVSHLALRSLATALASRGLAVLRVDYDGTGDSWGDDLDPGRVPAWQESIVTAARWLRAGGLADVALVGLRHGATLAASVAAECDAARVVLWDPVVSGARGVRELRAMGRLLELHPDPGTIAVAGTTYTEETLAALRALDLPTPAVPTFTVVRPGQEPPGEGVALPGQPELLDGDSVTAVIPQQTVAAITDWLAGQLPITPPTPPTPVTLYRDARAAVTVDGVCEEFVTVGGCTAVVTTPAAGQHDTGPPPAERGTPVVALLSNAIEPRFGPARSWVTWSRQLAQQGVTSVRVDLPGIGDTPPLPEVPERQPYAPYAPDVVAAVATAADRGHGVVLAGLCSGARNALDAVAAGLRPARGLILINAPVATGRPELEAITGADPEPAALLRAHAYHRVRTRLAARVPAGVWRALDRANLKPSAVRGLRAATGHADVLLVSGQEDFGLVLTRRTAAAALAALQGEHLTVVEVNSADHALFEPAGRREVLAAMTVWFQARYAAPSAAQ